MQDLGKIGDAMEGDGWEGSDGATAATAATQAQEAGSVHSHQCIVEGIEGLYAELERQDILSAESRDHGAASCA